MSKGIKTNMKFIKYLPFTSKHMNDDAIDCALWESTENICEFQHENDLGVCDNSGHYYGTGDLREPKFCARHFYQFVITGETKLI